MIRLAVDHLLSSQTYLAGMHKFVAILRRQTIETGNNGLLEIERFAEMRECAARLNAIAQSLDMPASRNSSARLIEIIERVAPFAKSLSPDRMTLLLDEVAILVSTFQDELGARLLIALPSANAHFFADEPMFGETVEDVFPAVAYDIAEAGKCRALGRWTATVMHLMRVLETGLEALATHVGVPHGENWNATLNAIETRLREVKRKVDGPEAEQWAAEAGVHLRFIKNAWRNHAMHPLERYDEERAVQIFDNSRSFMRHLATKLAAGEQR